MYSVFCYDVPTAYLATPPILQLASVDPSPAPSPGSVDSDAIGNEAALEVQRRVSNSDQGDVSKPSPLANGWYMFVYVSVPVCHCMVCVCVCVYMHACLCLSSCLCVCTHACINIVIHKS